MLIRQINSLNQGYRKFLAHSSYFAARNVLINEDLFLFNSIYNIFVHRWKVDRKFWIMKRDTFESNVLKLTDSRLRLPRLSADSLALNRVFDNDKKCKFCHCEECRFGTTKQSQVIKYKLRYLLVNNELYKYWSQKSVSLSNAVKLRSPRIRLGRFIHLFVNHDVNQHEE